MSFGDEARIWIMSYPWRVALIGGVLGALGFESIFSHSGDDAVLTAYHLGIGFFVGGVFGRLVAQGFIAYEEHSLTQALKKLTEENE